METERGKQSTEENEELRK